MANRAKQVEEPAAAVKDREHEQAWQAEVSAPGPMLGQVRGARVLPGLGMPADILAMQQAVGNRAVMRMLTPVVQTKALVGAVGDGLQRRMEGLNEPSDEEIHSAAAEGIRTPATTLPYLDRIQASFGLYSVGHVKVHIGAEASQSARAMNALAFASGDHVVFDGTPDLRTAAHETAHVVQQRAGVKLAGGVGIEGDVYERHADAVANAVVAGRSAEELLEPFAALPSYVGQQSIMNIATHTTQRKRNPGEPYTYNRNNQYKPPTTCKVAYSYFDIPCGEKTARAPRRMEARGLARQYNAGGGTSWGTTNAGAGKERRINNGSTQFYDLINSLYYSIGGPVTHCHMLSHHLGGDLSDANMLPATADSNTAMVDFERVVINKIFPPGLSSWNFAVVDYEVVANYGKVDSGVPIPTSIDMRFTQQEVTGQGGWVDYGKTYVRNVAINWTRRQALSPSQILSDPMPKEVGIILDARNKNPRLKNSEYLDTNKAKEMNNWVNIHLTEKVRNLISPSLVDPRFIWDDENIKNILKPTLLAESDPVNIFNHYMEMSDRSKFGDLSKIKNDFEKRLESFFYVGDDFWDEKKSTIIENQEKSGNNPGKDKRSKNPEEEKEEIQYDQHGGGYKKKKREEDQPNHKFIQFYKYEKEGGLEDVYAQSVITILTKENYTVPSDKELFFVSGKDWDCYVRCVLHHFRKINKHTIILDMLKNDMDLNQMGGIQINSDQEDKIRDIIARCINRNFYVVGHTLRGERSYSSTKVGHKVDLLWTGTHYSLLRNVSGGFG